MSTSKYRRCENLSIGYPEKTVARKINLEIEQGAHVAVLGDNGQGKTTFLRTLAGDLAPKSGKFKWGHGLKVAYYAQHVFSTLRPGGGGRSAHSSRGPGAAGCARGRDHT